jgi:5'-nucleotidase
MPSHASRRLVALATTTAAVCALALTPLTAASAAIVPDPIEYAASDAALSLTPLGTFETGAFDEAAAEIVAVHGDRLFVVNALAGSVSVLDYADPANMAEEFQLSAPGVANSVAVRADGLGVAAFEAPVKTDPGNLVFFDAAATDAESAVLGTVEVGALPDMVTFSKDGAYAVVANEGEPADDYSIDPEGSVSVVSLPDTVTAPAQEAARTATFHDYEADGSRTLPGDVRVFGPRPHGDDKPISRNLEPEYIAVDGGTAYAALQEANAVAVVDLASASVTDIWPLGFKDHGVHGSGLDASDRGGTIDIATHPGLKGVYMPDGIQSYAAGGQTYLVTANEGDAREWGDFIDEARVKDLGDDGLAAICAESPLAALTGDADLGRLNVVTDLGIADGADCYSELYAYGGRSFSIWTPDGTRVFDSGDDFEQITAAAIPEFFNSGHDESVLDSRSDAKGPEPENVAIGSVGDRVYAFVGLERVGGIMVYDITDPAASRFVTYVNNRDFASAGEAGLATAGDLGPEGIAFIPAESSTTGEPLLAVGNEVSGTTTVFEITDLRAPETTDIQVLTINDFHGRIEPGFGNGEAGAAVLAGAVDAFEAENANTLLVSSGDNIGASTFTSFIQDDEPTIEALVAAGLDVSAVGNHEFDRGFADLTGRVAGLYGSDDFLLGANVYDKGTTDPALPEYAIEEVDGVRVAFIGTVTEDTASMVSPTGIEDIEFGDQLEAANRVAAELTESGLADVIVLLTHDGSATEDCATLAAGDTDYARLVDGASAEIDAIVSGHTHQAYACEVPVDGVAGTERPVIQAHQYGTTLGKLDISVDTQTKELVSIGASLVPLVNADDEVALFPADPSVQALVDAASAEADVLGAVEVGEISADIVRGGTPPGDDRGVESSLGNLVADVYLWATSNDDYAGTPAQIGLMNPGGLRDDLLYGGNGVVTYRDVVEVQPFANTLVTVTLTGAQLKQVLEEQWQPAGSSRPKLHLGVSEGFTYEYDPTAPTGSRIVSMTLDGEPVAAGDTFTVVTNSFLAGGGDNFVTFAGATDRTDTGQVDLSASVAFFEQAGVVDPAPLGRAVLAGDENPTPTPTPTPGADWATVDIGSGTVEQGGSLPVKVSGLRPGQRISATLFSEPIAVQGIPAADEDGTVSFAVQIPGDLPLGEHTLVIESAGFDPIELAVTVVTPGALAITGAQRPWGIALAAALLVALGGALVVTRRRPASRG